MLQARSLDCKLRRNKYLRSERLMKRDVNVFMVKDENVKDDRLVEMFAKAIIESLKNEKVPVAAGAQK